MSPLAAALAAAWIPVLAAAGAALWARLTAVPRCRRVAFVLTAAATAAAVLTLAALAPR